MIKKQHIILLLTAFVLVACKKESLPNLPEGNEPVYRLEGKIDGNDLNFKLGDDGVALHNGLADENGLITYFGEMESVPTDEKIRIEFVQLETPIVGGELKVIEGNSIPFLVHEKAIIKFDYGGVGNQINNMMLINEDGNFELMRDITVDEFGRFDRKIKFPDYSEENEYNFVVEHGYNGGYLNGQFQSAMSKDTLSMSPIYSAGARHEWYLNDSLISTNSGAKIKIQPGIYEAKHIVFDGYDNPSEFSTIIRIKGGKRLWQMALLYDQEIDFVQRNFGRIKVSMYKKGEWFYSENAVSNMGQFFEVDSISTVRTNGDYAERILKFDLSFDAVLVNEDKTDSLDLSGVNGTFSVGME